MLGDTLDRGHEVALYTLGDPPDWFPLRAPVRSFEDYGKLVQAHKTHGKIVKVSKTQKHTTPKKVRTSAI